MASDVSPDCTTMTFSRMHIKIVAALMYLLD